MMRHIGKTKDLTWPVHPHQTTHAYMLLVKVVWVPRGSHWEMAPRGVQGQGHDPLEDGVSISREWCQVSLMHDLLEEGNDWEMGGLHWDRGKSFSLGFGQHMYSLTPATCHSLRGRIMRKIKGCLGNMHSTPPKSLEKRKSHLGKAHTHPPRF